MPTDYLHVTHMSSNRDATPEDRPYPRCLILGRAAGRPLHVVCAPVTAERKLVIITVYQPDPARWDPELRRRRTP